MAYYILSVCLFTCFATSQDLNFDKLAKGKKVFVEKAEKNADTYMMAELSKWGWFIVVTDQKEADLLIQVKASGVTFWNASTRAFIVDKETKEILYTAEKGKKTGSFDKAAERIVNEMKKRIEQRKK